MYMWRNSKQRIIIFLLLFSSVYLFAVEPSIKIGTQDYNIGLHQQGNFYVDITLTQPIGNLSLYGNYRNEMNLSRLQPLHFAPVQDYYTIGASYDFDFATIRLEHMCMHPVVSNNKWDGLQGGYTRFEIQIGD